MPSRAPLYLPASPIYLPPGMVKGNQMFWCVWFSWSGVVWLCRDHHTRRRGTAHPRVGQMPYQLVSDLVFRIRKVWQRRKCAVKNGILTISHATVSVSGDGRAVRAVPSGQTRDVTGAEVSLCSCAHLARRSRLFPS